MRQELLWSTSTGTFFKSLPAVLRAAQFSNGDGLSKQFLELADCLSICLAPRKTGSSPGEKDGVYENARRAPPLLGCAFTCQLLKGELSNPIKMQNIDIHFVVRVGQGESISSECKAFSIVLIHHVPRRGDSLNVFIAKTVRQTGELYPAGPSQGRG